ncbi:helix-turn-helix domain-containing protein [Streptosporangium sp. NPDC020145]|uniref:AraC-like ligand-binding domain-containing protein n=1 Tax=Streptosporangium sp. NPDC020145 TaxID=3154694 RepID=UPI00343FD23A
MSEVVFRIHDLPAADRFSRRRETTDGPLMPMAIRSDHEGTFHAVLRRISLGALYLSRLSSPPLRAWRTDVLIRRSDAETYCLSLPLRGGKVLDQGDRRVTAGPRDLLLYDAARPFHTRLLADATGSNESMILHIPKALMPLPADSLVRLTGRSLPCSSGVGALLRRHIIELARHTPGYSVADAARLSTITLDLVAATCAHVLEAGSSPQAGSSGQALRARIHAFIQRHLSDPALNVETIANAHQISTRYLHRLFQAQGISVAAWIRRCRLDRCRRDLSDPALCTVPVHAVATRWGFTDGVQFSRVFRAAQGVPPGEFRRRALEEPDTYAVE